MRESARALLLTLRDDVPWRSVVMVVAGLLAVFLLGFTVVYVVSAATDTIDRPLAPNTQPAPPPSHDMGNMSGY
jgi:hypothetical protein